MDHDRETSFSLTERFKNGGHSQPLKLKETKMKKVKVKAKIKKGYKECAACGAKVLESKGMMSDGKFYCGSACK
jgi:formylmethanofuran dehydrogenase subunit E